MTDVNFTNHLLLVRSLDKNNNGVMDELSTSEHLKSRIDTNRDGQIQRDELVSALKNDSVEINRGVISESRGTKIYTEGLETLKNVNVTSRNAKTYVWNMPSDLKGADGYREVLSSNREYAGAIRSMRTSLETINQLTGGRNDQTSRTVSITAKNALSTERALNFENLMINLLDKPSFYNDPFAGKPVGGRDIHSDPFSSGGKISESKALQIASEVAGHDGWVSKEDLSLAGYNISESLRERIAGSDSKITANEFADALVSGQIAPKGLENNAPSLPDPYEGSIRTQKEINANLKTSYTVLNSALQNIKEQTDKLPDVKQAIKATDSSISSAFANIEQIKNSSQTPEQVKEKLYGIARDEEGKVANRTGPYAGVGAGIGAVAGGAIGYFTTKSVKASLIGAGVGTAVAGGIGALIGKSVDDGYKNKASELRTLGDEVARYNVGAAEKTLQDATQQTYNEVLGARDKNDLDNARVTTKNLEGIRVGVAKVNDESARILGAYKR